jgi:carboxyl-terminal processing protease
LEGVKSDIIIKNQYSYIEMGEKDQDNPLVWDSIEPASYRQWSNQINYNYALSRSDERLKDSPYIKLVEKQAKRIENQQDDFTYTLNYQDYLKEQESNRNISEEFNDLKDYKSGLTFEWISYTGIDQDEVVKERISRWIESLQQDFSINEAVNILEDLNINLDNSVAQIKK